MTQQRLAQYCLSKRRLAAIIFLLPLSLGALFFEILLNFRSRWLVPQWTLEKPCKINDSYHYVHNHNHDHNDNDNHTQNHNHSISTVTSVRLQNTYYTGLAIVGAFNHQRDVFKHTKPVNASFEYIQSWYETIQQYPSMEGIVLHNMFTEEQIKDWATPQIHFVRVAKHTASFLQSQQRPINDMRFYVLRDFLQRLYAKKNLGPPSPYLSTVPDYILFSDSYDVRFLRNPFEYMQQTDQVMGQPQIYVGEEYAYQDRKSIWDQWMNKSSTKCFDRPLPPSSRMINCGLTGGHFSVVLELLERLEAQMNQANPHQVCDQISLYHVLSEHYQDKFISGYPFNALFNQWETENQTLAYIAHK